MSILVLLWQLVIWYYTVALFTFIWFLYHFFSIPVLVSTLFSKWKRIGDVRRKKFDIKDFFSVFIINSTMRLIGFFLRSGVIVAGIISIACAIVVETAFFFVWLFLPVIIVILFIVGIKLMFGLY